MTAEITRLSEYRPVMKTALQICLTLDGPLHREHPWAAMQPNLDLVAWTLLEEQQGAQMLLPWRLEVAA